MTPTCGALVRHPDTGHQRSFTDIQRGDALDKLSGFLARFHPLLLANTADTIRRLPAAAEGQQ
jgi:hypothetical protein